MITSYKLWDRFRITGQTDPREGKGKMRKGIVVENSVKPSSTRINSLGQLFSALTVEENRLGGWVGVGVWVGMCVNSLLNLLSWGPDSSMFFCFFKSSPVTPMCKVETHGPRKSDYCKNRDGNSPKDQLFQDPWKTSSLQGALQVGEGWEKRGRMGLSL